MIQAYAVVGLVLGVFSLLVAGALTIVVALRAQGRPRAFGVAGFGLLTLNQLFQLIAPTMVGVFAASPIGGIVDNGGVSVLFLVPTAIGVVVGAVAMVLLALAAIGVRAGSGPSDPSTPLR